MSRRGIALWSAAVVTTLAAGIGAAVLFVQPLTDRGATPTPTPSPSPPFTPAPVVLTSLTAESPAPEAPELTDVLQPLLSAKSLGNHVGAAVIDVETGEQVYGLRADDGFIPASTAKVLTATAALELLGPEHRFTTQVVRGAAPDEIVLVGGGDPLLTAAPADPKVPDDRLVPRPSRIVNLAATTAAQLKQQGVTAVRLGVDDGLFAGPAASPDWPAGYIGGGVVAPVSALSLDGGRIKPGDNRRVPDPALHAANVFAKHLKGAGIQVTSAPRRVAALPGAVQLAKLDSLPLASIAEWILATSDNDGAEMLARHAAIANGQPATFDGATATIVQVLSGLGVDMSGAKLRDASGLSRATRISPRMIAQTLAVAASPGHGGLRASITGLPVAGFSGSLSERFDRRTSSEGQGKVRAKTGTLTGVSSLAGILPAKDGATYVFAVMADQVTQGTAAARQGLDRVSAALVNCGCARPQRQAPGPVSPGT